ncbi:long-chain-fatty-acid--CoA ligase [Azorhizobium oxalatiphilum]|uniref:Long-chain-fatty-acid--CoA ligase n=1 Tax=Azorhizobium oxalatiphilum TaxID=980631 RepID=A0A917BN42_9HYPH|nr:AMP-binding protein [Azorhizobium oxalatiphilum]GGF52537.1 long-chain-fatty-acid--CoA ligase [Azorhizobium oxalatiphilum]
MTAARLAAPGIWPRTSDGRPATLVAAVAANAAEAPGRIGFREREFGVWQEWSWAHAQQEILAMAAGLEDLGLGPEEAFTVVGDNRVRMYFAMVAANMLRAFPSPVFPDVPVDEFPTYMRFGKPRIALAEDQEQVDKLLEVRARTGRPERIIYDDRRGSSTYAAGDVISLDDVIARGRARLAQQPRLASDLINRTGPDDITVLLYSSGTTGTPKGIPLRHRNIVAGVAGAEAGGHFRRHEELFAYLPTAWVGDFVFTVSAGLLLQATINVPERQETALHDLREVAPTFYLAAPRAWDNMLTRIQVGMADSTPLKRGLFNFFMPRAIAAERKRMAGGSLTLAERLVARVGEFVIYGPIKDYLGLSRAERAFTGGEAMGDDTFLFFRALGIKLKQFYGQTETCALSAAQGEDSISGHTVGPALPGVEVRIDETGEILIRAASVFDGYFDDDAATESALHEGWLRTGDAGYLEQDGSLVVLGRVSEVVRTSLGERFIPNFIENRLKFSAFVRNVAVFGAGREELTALVCIDYDAVGHWAEQRAIAYASYAELSQKEEVGLLVAGLIAQVNTTQPDALRIRRFINLHKDFDADDGEVTRTRKLRRSVIETNYAVLADALYDGSERVAFEAAITYDGGRRGTLRRELQIRKV